MLGFSPLSTFPLGTIPTPAIGSTPVSNDFIVPFSSETSISNSPIINYYAEQLALNSFFENYESIAARLSVDLIHNFESLLSIKGTGAASPWLSDNFNRADELLSASNGWVLKNCTISVVNNRAVLTINPNTSSAVATNSTGVNSPDYYVESVINLPATVSDIMGVGGRRVNFGALDSDYYAASLDKNSQTAALYKRVSGVYTLLGTWVMSPPGPADAVDYTLRLTMSGSTISVDINGVTRISVTDTSLTAQGEYCLTAFSGNTATTTIWDDFVASALTGTSPNNITVPYCADIGVSASPVLSYTALMAISRDALFDYDAKSPIQTTMIVSYDAAKSIEALPSASYEALLGVLTNVIVNFESLNGVTTTTVSNDFIISITAEGSIIVTFLPVYSVHQIISVSTLTDYETKSAALINVTMSNEASAALSSSAIVSNEAAQAITLNAVENYESVSLIFLDKILNFESLGVIEVPVSKDFIIAMESLGTAINAMTIDFSSVSNVQISSSLSFEAKATIQLSKTGDYESLSSVAAIGSLPFEVLQAISFLTNVPYEALLGSNVVVVFNLVAKTASFTLSLNRSISVKKSVTGTLTFKNKVDKTSSFH